MSRTPVHHLPISIPEVQQRMSRAQLNSDPLRQSRDLLDKIRRAISGDTEIAPSPLLGPTPLLPDRDYVDTDQLRSAVFDVIKKRLRNRSVDTSQLSEAVISWSLPKSYLQQDTWKLLLNHPLQTPIDLVNTALSLRPATPDTKLGFEVSKVELTLDRLVNEFTPEELMAALLDPKPSKTAKASDVRSFYIRSFRIQVKHLHQVLDGLVADGFGSIEQVKSWLAALEDIPMLRYVVIRYCGQTRNRSWDRHVQDIYSSTDTRFIVRFFRRIGSQCPDVLARAVVQTISPITSTLKLSPKEADMHERVLIALFGDGTLNLEVGGKDNMALTEADHSAFLSLGPTNLVADGKGLLLTSLHPHSQVTKDVLEYATSVREYVDENSTTTGRHQFDDQTQATIIKQATANMLSCPSGTTAVLVTVGSDLGDLEDNRIVPFFEGNSRSSIAIQDCFNHFALWEQPLGATFEPNTVRQLARAHSLPFVDLFAWFERSSEDYLAARKLLDQYLTAVKPLIILTLGEMQTFAMTTPVDTFSKQAFHNSRRSVQAVEENLGVPILGAYNGTRNNNEAIIVPCFHPSYLSHIGILKSKAQGLLAMVLAIAWHASYLAIKISITQPTLNRRQVCERVVAILNTKLQSNHVFGRAFLAAKRTFIGARDAYWSGRRLRGKAVTLPPVPTGILPTVIEHIRKGRVAAGNTLAGGIGGFEVLFRSVEVPGCSKQDNLRISLRWKDTSDGEDWEIGPILLPADVAPKSKKDNAKRFVYFVQNGLDIRNTAGKSLGGRKPVSSGKVRTETLPISSVVLSMSENDNLNIFLHHWQEVVNVNLSDAWKGPDNAPQTDKFFSALFFKRSPTKRALPFTMKSLKPDTYQYYLDDLRTTLPANTGDMLWLVDRFLAETFPAGGELDLAAGSEVGTSVYHAIASFCSQQRYKNHPHHRTMLALTNIVEQGSDERMIATNALVYACQLLREPFEKKSKTLKFKVAGEVKQTKRFVLIIGSKTPKDTVCDWTEELESDALIISDDYSDDEGEAKAPSHSRRRRRSSAAREGGEQEEGDGDDTAVLHPRKLMRYNTIGGRKDR